MSVLVIDEFVRAAIQVALVHASQNPIPLEMIKANAAPDDRKHLKLKDRRDATIVSPLQHVEIPRGYRVAVSFEQQPMGLCKHLSISVAKLGNLPSPEAVQMIAEEFGMNFPYEVVVWLEEFEPGHEAVNILAPVTTGEGHA